MTDIVSTNVRLAGAGDIPFLVRGILAAEQVPRFAPVTTYERHFRLTRDEVEQFVAGALAEALSGHQLALSAFRIAECDGEPAGCCAGWIESTSRASGLSVAMLLSRFLGATRWREAQPAVRMLRAVTPVRCGGALQLESFFVHDRFRGLGVASRLIEHHVAAHLPSLAAPATAEIILYSENAPAARAYARSGFTRGARSDQLAADVQEALGSEGLLKLVCTLVAPSAA